MYLKRCLFLPAFYVWWVLTKVIVRIMKTKIKSSHMILFVKLKLQISCLVMKFKIFTKYVQMEIRAKFTFSITKLASYNIIFNPLINLYFLFKNEQ